MEGHIPLRQEKCGWNIWTSLPAPFFLLPSSFSFPLLLPTHLQPVGLVGEKGLGLGLSFLSFISTPMCWVACLTGGLQLSPFSLACWEGFIREKSVGGHRSTLCLLHHENLGFWSLPISFPVLCFSMRSHPRGEVSCCLCGPQSPNKYHGVCLNYLEGKGSRSVWIVDAAVQFPSQTWPQGSNIFKDLETDFTG